MERLEDAHGAFTRSRRLDKSRRISRAMLKPRYGISVEEFLEQKRAQMLERERIAGRQVRSWREIEQSATLRPSSDYGGTY